MLVAVLISQLLVAHSSSLPGAAAESCTSIRGVVVASSAQLGAGARNAAGAAAQSSAQSSANTAASQAAQQSSQPVTQPFTQPVMQPFAQPAAQQFTQPAAQQSAQPATQSSAQPSSVNSAPATENAAPALRGMINPSTSQQPEVTKDKGAIDKRNIESFFQITKEPTRQASNAVPTGADSQGVQQRKGRSGRMLFRIMDNVGIPMFFSDTGADLDPRLRRNYQDPPFPEFKPTNIPDKSKPINSNYSDGARSDAQSILHKIPESQLEGTEFTPPPNVKTAP